MHRCIAPADSPTLLTCKIGRLTSQYNCRLPRGEGFPRMVKPRMPWVPKTHGSSCYQATNSALYFVGYKWPLRLRQLPSREEALPAWTAPAHTRSTSAYP
jgi:hypothetical protein